MLPTEFLKHYIDMKVATEHEYKYVSVRRYVSGEPRKKKWVKEAFWDFECFVHRKQRYAPPKGNYTGHHELYSNAFVAYGLTPPAVEIDWSKMSLCFYGKGTPASFARTLTVIAYYLNHAKLPLGYLGWSRPVTLSEYAEYYLGLDCNGFAGSYYEVNFPATNLTGNDHINYHDTRKTLKVRESLAEVKTGDMLAREGSSGGGTRHVTLVENLRQTSETEAQALIVHSSGSRGGLTAETLTLRKLDGKSSDGHGKLKWRLAGYHDFHHIVGPK